VATSLSMGSKSDNDDIFFKPAKLWVNY
jgi:hypothetical protein